MNGDISYMSISIADELKKLPEKPGVYLMHDASDSVIYVGKAVNLKRRVSQYFQKRARSPKIERMISLIDHFEYMVVGSEMEALVLECNLIKEYRPRYNTMLMDDKTYPFIKVTVDEPFPRVFFTRERKHDKSKYFGPYTNVTAAKDTLNLLKQIYPVRLCGKKIEEGSAEKPCLYYHMGRCKAPCAGLISSETYREFTDAIVDFLNGNSRRIVRELTAKMQACSDAMEFEKAAEYRDQIFSIKKVSEVQRVTGPDAGNRDVMGLATAGDEAVVQVFFIRGGKMVGREHYYLTGVEHETRGSVLGEFIKQFYSGAPSVPKELLISEEIPEAELVAEWLSAKAGSKVTIHAPKRGDKEGLVKLACTNASTVLIKDSERLAVEQKRTTGALAELGEILGIEPPARIESYDISNISGFESVGSMVVYEDGKPKRSDYRKFRIRTVQGSDDYASLAEVLTRRFEHGERERRELEAKRQEQNAADAEGTQSGDELLGRFTRYPDLIMMDGGRGQVNIALGVFEKLGLSIKVCGMVKDDKHRTRGLYFNNVELPIDTHGECFKLITRIQDETHRFAIEYHRLLRSKEQVHSILDDIKGIGPARRRALMKHFESIEDVRNASVGELAEVPGMNPPAAQAVWEFFHKPESGT